MKIENICLCIVHKISIGLFHDNQKSTVQLIDHRPSIIMQHEWLHYVHDGYGEYKHYY